MQLFCDLPTNDVFVRLLQPIDIINLMNEPSDKQDQFKLTSADFRLFLDGISGKNPFDLIITQDSTNESPRRFVVSLQDLIDLKIEQLDSNQLSQDDLEKFMKFVDYFALISKALQKALKRCVKNQDKVDERDSTLW